MYCHHYINNKLLLDGKICANKLKDNAHLGIS